MERTGGRLQFGDGRARPRAAGESNNVRVVTSRAAAASATFLLAVSIVLGSVAAAKVFNPIRASGGADGELTSTLATILERGPQLVRHRHRAASAEDYEQLARAASPSVAMARVVTPASNGCIVPRGSVHVIIVPHAEASDPEPTPSRELLSGVAKYLQLRVPAGVAGRVTVGPPSYFRVGVEAALMPRNAEVAGELSRNAKTKIALFLHPVLGGSRARLGLWRRCLPLGPDQMAARRPRAHLAYVQDLHLLDVGASVREQLTIPAGQVPCAGPIRVIINTASEVCP